MLYLFICMVGFICGFLLNNIIKAIKEAKKIEEGLSSNEESKKEEDIFLKAEDMLNISKESADMNKCAVMKDLMWSIRKAAEMGQSTWYAHQATSVSHNIKEYLTQQEVLDVLEPLGYKVSFNPISTEADLLIIKWKKD